MPRPIILGVVGDSAAGKTTITRGLVRCSATSTSRTSPPTTTTATTAASAPSARSRRCTPTATTSTSWSSDLAHVRAGRAILKPVYQHKDGTFGPPVYVEPRQFTVVEGLLGYHTPSPARQLRRARLPRPARGAAPPVEGAARLLAPRLHDRPGARGARPARARLGGLHPPAAALGGHRRLLHAGRQRRPGPPRRRAHAARRPRPPRPERAHRRRPEGMRLLRGRRRAPSVDPGRHRRRRGRGGRGGDLGSHALRQPPALRAPGRVHRRAPSCTARSRWRSCRCSSSTTW